ncbi:MAG: hypothetical protein AAF802_17290 [Planctomycetota bacterium]
MPSVSDSASNASRPRRPIALASVFILLGSIGISVACPFCESVQQTIRQQSLTMDAVAIASSLNSEATRNLTTGVVRMRIEKVLKGGEFLKAGQEVDAIYYGQVDVGRRFLLSGVDPPELKWSCLPVSDRAEKYIVEGNDLPDDSVERLRYYRDYLEDEETLISRDAYDEFASTPYDIIRDLGPDMDRERLLRWVKLPDLGADRRRLYFTMLGVCGTPDDLPMLEEMLRQPANSITGLDAMIACYLTLAGEKGLPLIEKLFIENKRAPFPSSYAAIMAIRFHGTDGDVIARSALSESLHKVLDRPELADMVIPDLAKWNDWSQIDRLVQLFVEADEENNWLRVPVVNYMRACPLPEAEEAINQLEKIDPNAVLRAKTFFPIPVPARARPSKSDAAATPPRPSGERLTEYGQKYAQLAVPALAAQPAEIASSTSNRWQLLCVLGTSLLTVMLAMFLVLTGGSASEALGA